MKQEVLTLPAISIHSAQKNYGSLEALRGVSLEIPQGEFFGLLGPNGAGKTTLIHSLVGLVKLNAGKVEILGRDIQKEGIEARRAIGFAPQEANVDRFFNLRRTLEFQAGFYGFPKAWAKKRAEEMLEQFRLTDKANEQFYKLSGGMQKRLIIARALMSQPKILILDEPTAGVDVEQRQELWEYVRGLNRDGTTILLTTHYIEEAEELCERVAFITRGQIRELGSPQALIDQYCQEQLEIHFQHPLQPQDFSEIFGAKVEKNQFSLVGSKLGKHLNGILEKADQRSKNPVLDLKLKRGSLEEVFLRVTGEAA